MGKICNLYGGIFFLCLGLNIQAMVKTEAGSASSKLETFFDDDDKLLFPPLLAGEICPGEQLVVPLLRFTHDGRRILVANQSKDKLMLWDADTVQEVISFDMNHIEEINSVQFTKDDKWLLTISDDSEDGAIRIFDTASGQLLALFEDKEKTGKVSAQFSLDEKSLLIADTAGGATLWDISSLEKPQIKGIYWKNNVQLKHASFSHNEEFILTLNFSGEAMVWGRKSGSRLQTFGGDEWKIEKAWFDPSDTKLLVWASNEVRLLEIGTKRLFWAGPSQHIQPISPGGKIFDFQEKSVCVRDTLCPHKGERPVYNLSYLPFRAKDVSYCRDGVKLAIANENGAVMFWNKKFYRSFQSNWPLIFSPDGKRFLSVYGGGAKVYVYELPDLLFENLTNVQAKELKKVVDFLKSYSEDKLFPYWCEYLCSLTLEEQVNNTKVFSSLPCRKQKILNSAFIQ